MARWVATRGERTACGRLAMEGPATAGRRRGTEGTQMVCDNCRERDAVVQLVQVTEDGKRHLHLCEKCAAAKGVETTVSTPKTPLHDFLMAVQQQMGTGVADAARCTFCSLSLRDF